MLKFLVLSLAMCELNAMRPDISVRQANQEPRNKLVVKSGTQCYIWKAPSRILKGLLSDRERLKAVAALTLRKTQEKVTFADTDGKILYNQIFENISDSTPISMDQVPEVDTQTESRRCKGKDIFVVKHMGRI